MHIEMTTSEAGDSEAKQDFAAIQRRFTRHIRNNAEPAPVGIEDRRMGIYRDLLYNNVENFLAQSFPVLRKITPEAQWHRLIRDYFAQHRAHTPLFPKMPLEFVNFLQNERGTQAGDPPYLAELAHYEWIEIAASLDVRELPTQTDKDGDLLLGRPMLNPICWFLNYHFPVHRISPDYLPERPAAEPVYLAVCRGRDYAVRFFEVNPVAAHLLNLMRERPTSSGHELLRSVAEELGRSDPQTVIEGGRQLMEQMRQRDLLLGTRREPGPS